jgi:hypothetical protein
MITLAIEPNFFLEERRPTSQIEAKKEYDFRKV